MTGPITGQAAVFDYAVGIPTAGPRYIWCYSGNTPSDGIFGQIGIGHPNVYSGMSLRIHNGGVHWTRDGQVGGESPLAGLKMQYNGDGVTGLEIDDQSGKTMRWTMSNGFGFFFDEFGYLSASNFRSLSTIAMNPSFGPPTNPGAGQMAMYLTLSGKLVIKFTTNGINFRYYTINMNNTSDQTVQYSSVPPV
jgi:hypothetical protein